MSIHLDFGILPLISLCHCICNRLKILIFPFLNISIWILSLNQVETKCQ